MPRIKPVSSLRNYNQVLRDISVGEPVFLTKNGRGSQATIKLLGELNKGRKSGEEKGWFVQGLASDSNCCDLFIPAIGGFRHGVTGGIAIQVPGLKKHIP
jgi:hypothetical protein